MLTDEFTARDPIEFGKKLQLIGKQLENGDGGAILTANAKDYYEGIYGENKSATEQLNLNDKMETIKLQDAADAAAARKSYNP